jgi:hypothetical protein
LHGRERAREDRSNTSTDPWGNKFATYNRVPAAFTATPPGKIAGRVAIVRFVAASSTATFALHGRRGESQKTLVI